MSDTYARVTSEGLLVWQFERAQLIDEFKDTKPPLPPPLNVLWLAFVTMPSYLRKLCRAREGEEDVSTFGFKLVPSQRELNTLSQREADALKHCLQAREKREDDTLDARIGRLQAAVAKLDEQARGNFEAVNGRLDVIQKEGVSLHV